MTGWMIAGMALVTYLTRAPLLILLRGDLPEWLMCWLRFVPIAVFVALVVPAFVAPERRPEISGRLLVGIVAALVAWRTRQVYAVIVAGLIVFGALRLLGVS
jgi:branched-subunit amino acid transport protein